ncbi:hypothetical protein JZ751_021130 [Albula glossodonta]|uniref:Uncharacterized protein n=1 Tax=Albula glossodonta TaxID=121402 RepID=A0A8T2PL55_9TELE|nr:hypothetical protein JZ751_021130 [Albula glossodonta]
MNGNQDYRPASQLINPASLSDGDGYQDQLLPACMDETCQKSAIYLYKPGDAEVRCPHQKL